MDPVKISCSNGNSPINILEFGPVGFLSIVAFPGPSEAAVDPQQSGSSGQIQLSAVFLIESSIP